MSDDKKKSRTIAEILTQGFDEISEVLADKFEKTADKIGDKLGIKIPCGKAVKGAKGNKKCGRNAFHQGECSILSEEQYQEAHAEAEKIAEKAMGDQLRSRPGVDLGGQGNQGVHITWGEDVKNLTAMLRQRISSNAASAGIEVTIPMRQACMLNTGRVYLQGGFSALELRLMQCALSEVVGE